MAKRYENTLTKINKKNNIVKKIKTFLNLDE